MFLSKLHLENFRNYRCLSLNFENKINLLLGKNAQGKTNILESIYTLAMANSHRTSNDRDLINWHSDIAKVKGEITKKNKNILMDINFSMQGKRAIVNKIAQNKLSLYIGNFNVVIFAPEDLEIVKGNPNVRRRFMDMEIGQIFPVYLNHLSKYKKILHQRNCLLKQINKEKKKDYILLEILTEQIIELGLKIILKRIDFIDFLQEKASEIHLNISSKKENLLIKYNSSIGFLDKESLVSNYKIKINKLRQKEIERGMTLIGPHRDDFLLFINEKPVSIFGSQGQQRTAALSIKMAEIELIFSETKEYPVLLLDDVLSELDSVRQSHLLERVHGKTQTFITATSVEDINHETLKKASRFTVNKGLVF